jgi:predicted nucleotidyltransferase
VQLIRRRLASNDTGPTTRDPLVAVPKSVTLVPNMGTASPAGTGSDRVAEALFGKTRRRLLALFFGQPHQTFYLRQIARETGTGIGPVQRELQRLLGAGLITRTDVGSQSHYAANQDSPVYPDLQSLVTRTAGIADVVREALARPAARGGIRVAFIYGSVAARRQSAQSDVDLMVVGDVSTIQLLPTLRKAQERLGREINPTVYREREFREKARSRGHLIARVLLQPRIMVIGSHDDLEKLVAKPLARRA